MLEGIDADLANKLKRSVRALVRQTHGPQVLGKIGEFGTHTAAQCSLCIEMFFMMSPPSSPPDCAKKVSIFFPGFVIMHDRSTAVSRCRK
jgi:hypothetical protein